MRQKVASDLNRKLATFFICKYKSRKEFNEMTTEEEIKKAEQEVNRAKKKLAEAKRKAQKEKRAEENSRKFMMGGLVAKYLREDMALDFMDFSEEEITRIVACGMKQRDTRNMVQKVISERPATEQETNVETEDNGEGGNE